MYFQHVGPGPTPPAKTSNYETHRFIHGDKMPATLERLKTRLFRFTEALSKRFEQLPNTLFVCDIDNEWRNAATICVERVSRSGPVPNWLKKP